MVKRTLVEVLFGVMLAFGSQILQYGAYLLLLLAGFPMPYESAPPDPGSHPDWVVQMNLMSLVAAVPALLLAFVVAWLMKTRGVGEGVRRGVIWAAVVLVWHLVIGVGNGTLAAFGVPGPWVYFAAFAVGPILAGWLRGRRPGALVS